MFRLLIPCAIVLVLAIYLYPTSVVQIVQWDSVPKNPQYPHYLILYPGETHIGTISRRVTTNVSYIKIAGPIYDRWSPRLLSKEAILSGECTFGIEEVVCNGRYPTHMGTYIRAPSEEIFNMNSTDQLYLARAYEKSDPEKSIQLYSQITSSGHDLRDQFYPLYRIAVLKMDMTLFLSVFHRYPHRKEPLYYLARNARTHGNFSECLLYARSALMIGSPNEGDLFVENAIYQYGIELELAHCLYYTHRQGEAKGQWIRILDNVPNLPESVKSVIEKNLREG